MIALRATNDPTVTTRIVRVTNNFFLFFMLAVMMTDLQPMEISKYYNWRTLIAMGFYSENYPGFRCSKCY